MEDQIYKLLNELKIDYKKLEHEAISSVKNCIKLEGQQVKNLVLKAKKTDNIYLIILHDEKIINLNRLAEILNEKRLSFASETTLLELLNCKAGSVTPFGLIFDKEFKVNVIVDEAVDKTLTVGFHPFVNTKTLNIKFEDFIKFLEYVNHSYKILNLE